LPAGSPGETERKRENERVRSWGGGGGSAPGCRPGRVGQVHSDTASGLYMQLAGKCIAGGDTGERGNEKE